MTTTEKNELIAKFLGYTQPHPGFYNSTYWFKEGKEPLVLLSFDRDWNWLMQVVKKIDEVCGIDLHEWDEHINNALCSKSLHTTYNACVEFVQWYNQNK
jgi:hypothetical protein